MKVAVVSVNDDDTMTTIARFETGEDIPVTSAEPASSEERPCSVEGCTALATAECHYCEEPLCTTHNVGYYGWCQVQYDACPGCAHDKEERTAKLENILGMRH